MNKYPLIAFLLLATQLFYGQQTIPASAGEATGTGGSSSFTVGQVFYTTNTSSTGSVSQGMQQAFEIQTRSNPSLSTVQLTAVTYPNPSTDYLVLKITDTAIENLQYTLFDLNSKTITSKKIMFFI